MVSPAVEIKEGAGAYQSSDGGFDATPAATITIHLIDTSADSWSISCISTDDTSVAATVTSGLTIDTVARTASFTAPAAGKAYRFQSVVNGGVNGQGRSDSSYTTTFCVYTLTGGRRVLAADETTESDATFGWIASYNDMVRNPTTAAAAGSDNQFQYNNGGSILGGSSGLTYDESNNRPVMPNGLTFSDGGFTAVLDCTPSANRTLTLPDATDTIVGRATTDTLTNKTLTSPTIGGTPVVSATSVQATGNARCKVYSDIANVQTTDATVTSAFTWTITDEAVTQVTVEALAVKSDGTTTASYVRRVRIKRDGGTVTVGTVESTFTDEEAGFSTCEVTIDNSTSTGRVRVTGVAATTIDWGIVINRIEVTHA